MSTLYGDSRRQYRARPALVDADTVEDLGGCPWCREWDGEDALAAHIRAEHEGYFSLSRLDLDALEDAERWAPEELEAMHYNDLKALASRHPDVTAPGQPSKAALVDALAGASKRGSP